ncbi:MAG TPA: cytochrome c [Chthonomonadaceae bacterium]|nr:cytochrome c [Chthonomonadaceae bacterium]
MKLRILGILALLFLLPGCWQDMWTNARVMPLAASPVFVNDRSSRPLVPDTVARGHADLDQAFYTGFVNGKPVLTLPVPLTRALLLRGQQRFDIYCSPCHGYAGYGNGMIVQRGFPAPPSYHSDRPRKAPIGHFFDVMTNGYGLMYSYADRVTPEDRWAIAAYIRALQRSQDATTHDVPPGTPMRPEGAEK